MAFPQKSPFKISTSETILAYTAGLIDGEGYIGVDRNAARREHSIRQNDFYRLNVAVTVTDKSMIDFLMANFGGNSRQRKRHTCNKKLVYEWHLYGGNAVLFLQAIKPYMVAKADQADLAEKFRSSFSGGIYCKSGTPEAVVRFRHECYEKFKEIHGRHSAKPTTPIALRLLSA